MFILFRAFSRSFPFLKIKSKLNFWITRIIFFFFSFICRIQRILWIFEISNSCCSTTNVFNKGNFQIKMLWKKLSSEFICPRLKFSLLRKFRKKWPKNLLDMVSGKSQFRGRLFPTLTVKEKHGNSESCLQQKRW